MRRAWLVAVAALFLTGPSVGAAQRVEVELSGGAAIGNYTGTDAGLDVLPRVSVGLRGDLWLTRQLAGYVGFTRSSFGCNEAFCAGREVLLTSQGLVAGVHWAPGVPWVRAGLAVQAVDVRTPDRPDEHVDAGLGAELAAGAAIPLGERFTLRPGVRYLRHGADPAGGEEHVSLLALELGVSGTLASF